MIPAVSQFKLPRQLQECFMFKHLRKLELLMLFSSQMKQSIEGIPSAVWFCCLWLWKARLNISFHGIIRESCNQKLIACSSVRGQGIDPTVNEILGVSNFQKPAKIGLSLSLLRVPTVDDDSGHHQKFIIKHIIFQIRNCFQLKMRFIHFWILRNLIMKDWFFLAGMLFTISANKENQWKQIREKSWRRWILSNLGFFQ